MSDFKKIVDFIWQYAKVAQEPWNKNDIQPVENGEIKSPYGRIGIKFWDNYFTHSEKAIAFLLVYEYIEENNLNVKYEVNKHGQYLSEYKITPKGRLIESIEDVFKEDRKQQLHTENVRQLTAAQLKNIDNILDDYDDVKKRSIYSKNAAIISAIAAIISVVCSIFCK